jgi:hypothetical protein
MPPASSALKASGPDVLANLRARGKIDEAQYRAGREFQRCFHLADKRREGNGHLGDDQTAAWRSLTSCYRALGQDGSVVINAALIDGLSAKQIAESRGTKGADWERFYRRRLSETLDCIAAVYGFSEARVAVTKRGRAAPASP